MKFHDGPCAPSFWFPSGERQIRLLLEMYDQGGVIEFTNRIYFDRCGAEFSITTLRGLDHKGLVHYSWPFRTAGEKHIVCKATLTDRGKAIAEYIRRMVAGEAVRLIVVADRCSILSKDDYEKRNA